MMTTVNAVVPLKVDRAARLTEADPTIVIPLAKSIAIKMIVVVGMTVIAAVKIIVVRTTEVHRGIETIVMDVRPRTIAIMVHLPDITVVNDFYRDISVIFPKFLDISLSLK